MNRDQWNLKIQREAEMLRRVDIVVGASAGRVIFDRRTPSFDRRGTMPDRRLSANRRESRGGGTSAMRPVEKYGRCCEWGLSATIRNR